MIRVIWLRRVEGGREEWREREDTERIGDNEQDFPKSPYVMMPKKIGMAVAH